MSTDNESKLPPDQQAALDEILAGFDEPYERPASSNPPLDRYGFPMVVPYGTPKEEIDELMRKKIAARGPSKYKDLPMPVIDVQAGGKADKPWRIVVPMEFGDILNWNLKRLGYPNTHFFSYRQGGHETNNEGRAEMAWRDWPDWGFLHIPYYIETDAPHRLVLGLIDQIVVSDECAAWIEDEYGFKGYTDEEWAISADNPDNA